MESLKRTLSWCGERPALTASVGAAVLTAIILLISFAWEGIAPFGGDSLAAMDAEIQYLDFYAYYKDVLLGKNSIDYTFSSYLGGNTLGLFSYYLSSPFTLLVLLFPDDALPLFFDVMVLLKLPLAAALMSFFLARRFSMRSDRIAFGILLGAAYGLSQYSIAQASNIMWLDAVYLLPVMLLGVHRVIEGERIWVLSVSVGLALVFNWYAGAMAVLFTAFWACFEMLVLQAKSDEWTGRRRWSVFWRAVVRYLIALVLGVCLSAVLFLPTVLIMRNGARGTMEWELLADPSFVRELPALVQGYALDAKSSATTCSLYSGAFVLVGCLGAIFASTASKRTRLALGTCAFVVAMIICWAPLDGLFLLLKQSYSYYVRYAFVGIAALVALAGWYFLSRESGFTDPRRSYALICATLVFVALQLILNYVAPAASNGLWPQTMFVELITLALVAWYIHRSQSRRIGAALTAAVLVLGCIDLGWNARNQFVLENNVESFAQYEHAMTNTIKAIRSADPAPDYRIAQTSNRHTNSQQNESLAFGYKSISGYSSIADSKQMRLLSDLGYRYTDIVATHITPLITMESLLGVKYVLSDYAVKGLKTMPIPLYGSKMVCENPYCLPLAFTTSDEAAALPVQSTDPFALTNELYRDLSGISGNVYEKVDYAVEENAGATRTVKYVLSVPQGKYVLYGNLPGALGALDANGEWQTTLGTWVSAGAFYIPTSSTSETATVTFTPDTAGSASTPQFYALDLDMLETMTKTIEARAAQVNAFQNGHVEFEADAETGQYLYASIPADEGWSITVNGETVQPAYVLDCLYLIPLQAGHNAVVMNYHGPNMIPGLLLTLAAAACLVVLGRRKGFIV